MNCICIQEYGVLYSDSVAGKGLDDPIKNQVIPAKAWNWLLKATGTDEHKCLVRPINRSGRLGLQVMNYVGVITTPCGCQIEIVPKIDNYSNEKSRCKLFTMLSKVESIKFKSFQNASLKLFNQTIPEVLIHQFLIEVKLVVKRGIRNDYISVKEELPFLRGRLQVAAQLRQPIGRQHLFQVEHDDFQPNRAENRLIHSALKKVVHWAKSYENQRLANELLFVFDDIPISGNIKQDFKRWFNDRSMVHYRGLKEWCELIINEESPYSLAGNQHGLSFLFPMNDLFEEYVAKFLEKRLAHDFGLTEQKPQKYLAYRGGKGLFTMKPDIVIHKDSLENSISILDTKWKRIDQEKTYENGSEDHKRGVSQADMYQLYAYGQKYLKGSGDMFLIYPESETFNEPLDIFNFEVDSKLRLRAVPFKLSLEKNGLDGINFGDHLPNWYLNTNER